MAGRLVDRTMIGWALNPAPPAPNTQACSRAPRCSPSGSSSSPRPSSPSPAMRAPGRSREAGCSRASPLRSPPSSRPAGSLPGPSAVSFAGIAVRSPHGSFSFPLYALDAVPVILFAAAVSELGSDRPIDLSDPRELVALLYPILFVLLALVSTHFITLQGVPPPGARARVLTILGRR